MEVPRSVHSVVETSKDLWKSFPIFRGALEVARPSFFVVETCKNVWKGFLIVSEELLRSPALVLLWFGHVMISGRAFLLFPRSCGGVPS